MNLCICWIVKEMQSEQTWLWCMQEQPILRMNRHFMEGIWKIIWLNYSHFYQVRSTFKYGLPFCWKWFLRISMYQFAFFSCMWQEQILVNLNKKQKFIKKTIELLSDSKGGGELKMGKMRQFQESRQQTLMSSFFKVKLLGWMKSDNFSLCCSAQYSNSLKRT